MLFGLDNAICYLLMTSAYVTIRHHSFKLKAEIISRFMFQKNKLIHIKVCLGLFQKIMYRGASLQTFFVVTGWWGSQKKLHTGYPSTGVSLCSVMYGFRAGLNPYIPKQIVNCHPTRKPRQFKLSFWLEKIK